MLLNKTGLFSSIVLSASLLVIPMVAHADLTIVNNTGENSTSIINSGICSVALPNDVGVTKALKTNIVPQKTLDLVCFFHPNDCKADIFMNPPPAEGQKDTCIGFPIATVTFSTTTGVTAIQMRNHPTKHYKISGNGFHLTIDPM